MKLSQKLWRALAALVLALGVAGAASGATQGGSLDTDAGSADLLKVTCSNDGSGDPNSLAVQVRDDSPSAAPLVSVQVRRASAATNSTDPTDADGAFSPLATVNGGAGVYDVFVDKTAAGAEAYTLSFQCMTGPNGTGVPTGTSISPQSTPIPALPLLALLCLAFALGGASVASAHELDDSLGAAASATDAYQVNCSNDGSGAPQSLGVEILDPAPAAAPVLSVQAQKGTELVNSSDSSDGDATPSPAVYVNGGGGLYTILVDKSAAGAESYLLEYHCYTAPNGGGVHAGTTLTTLQNQ